MNPIQKKIFFDGDFGKICCVSHQINFSGRKSDEIVIIVHGFKSNKNTSAKRLATKLNNIGVNTLRIDLDNRGESELDFKTGCTIPNYVS